MCEQTEHFHVKGGLLCMEMEEPGRLQCRANMKSKLMHMDLV